MKTEQGPDQLDDEARDAKQVDRAVAAMMANHVTEAEELLLQVIERTPADYHNELEGADGALTIKFWDQHDFIHYVTWQQAHGTPRAIEWIGNAYPRAHYYLGFLYMKTRQYQRALEYLKKGEQLEPTNPKFQFEKAQAAAHLGDHTSAFALYSTVNELGPYVSGSDLAVARRGCGFILIELNRLDEAEAALHASLELEPGNPIALGELQYIEQLRAGGQTSPAELVDTQGPSLAECSICGDRFSKGKIIPLGGYRAVCECCERKLTKKWWQFWK